MCMPVLRFLTFSQWNHIEYTTLQKKKTPKQKTKKKKKKKKETKQDKKKTHTKTKINE